MRTKLGVPNNVGIRGMAMTDDLDCGGPRRSASRDSRKTQGGVDPTWIDSRTLFGAGDEIVIRHGDQIYRLRITRYGRLILNK